MTPLLLLWLVTSVEVDQIIVRIVIIVVIATFLPSWEPRKRDICCYDCDGVWGWGGGLSCDLRCAILEKMLELVRRVNLEGIRFVQACGPGFGYLLNMAGVRQW